jgi:DNA repair protein RadC
MGIKDWPADERPREKLLERGAESLTDAELLAQALKQALALVEVRILDHFMVAGAGLLSFAESGLL